MRAAEALARNGGQSLFELAYQEAAAAGHPDPADPDALIEGAAAILIRLWQDSGDAKKAAARITKREAKRRQEGRPTEPERQAVKIEERERKQAAEVVRRVERERAAKERADAAKAKADADRERFLRAVEWAKASRAERAADQDRQDRNAQAKRAAKEAGDNVVPLFRPSPRHTPAARLTP